MELHAGLGADGPDVEGIVHDFRPFGKNVNANVLEVHIVKPHVDENLLLGNGPAPHIDPVRWPPDYELLPVLRARRRGAPIAPGSIRLHEVRDPGSDVATGQFIQFTAADGDAGLLSFD